MSKLEADDLTGVSETLLIPLHYRVAESRSGAGAFRDDVAECFHDAIAYDWEKFQGNQLQRPGIVARTRILDREVGAFVDAYREDDAMRHAWLSAVSCDGQGGFAKPGGPGSLLRAGMIHLL